MKSASRARISSARLGLVQIAGQRHHPRLHRRGGHRVEGVQQRGGGDVGGGLIADAGGQPRLRLAGHRRLGDHQHDVTGHHEITRQKSSAAMTLPRTEPLTFDLPPVRGPYGDVAFDDPPARLRGAHQQLQRVARIGGR